MGVALAFGFFFDLPIAENLDLVDRVLDLTLGDHALADLLERQTYMPMATGKMRKPASLDWPRLRKLVAKGDVITFCVRTDTASGDARQIELALNCIGPAFRDKADFHHARIPHAYQGHLSLGGEVLAGCRDVDAFVSAVCGGFASRLRLAAGVVVAEPTHLDAYRIARCSGGLPGVGVSDRCDRLWIAQRSWGPFAREPEWGTFLQRRHAEAIGGAAAIRAAVEPFALVEADDLVYVQVTPYAEALGATATAKIAALETLMRPVLDGPSTRRP